MSVNDQACSSTCSDVSNQTSDITESELSNRISTREERTIFVGGLSPNTNEIDLRLHFCQFGDLEDVKLIYDHYTRNSRQFGFITYLTAKGLEHAIECWTEHIINGNLISIRRFAHQHKG